MLKIAIVDDEQQFRDDLKKKINCCLSRIQEIGEIELYSSGLEFLKCWKKFDLVFLDVIMPGKDGIETGFEIRKRDKNCAIIMATGSEDRFQEVFLFHAFRYIMKPFEEMQIMEALKTYVEEWRDTDFIEVFDNRYPIKLPLNEVRYIQAYDSYCRIVAKKKIYRSEMPLKDYENLLDNTKFFRINRTYIVNLKYVKDLKKSDSVIIGENKIKIPKSRRLEWHNAVIKYDAKYGENTNV